MHFPVTINISGWIFLFAFREVEFKTLLKAIPRAVTRGSVSQIFLEKFQKGDWNAGAQKTLKI